jgi:hypothetical protein
LSRLSPAFVLGYHGCDASIASGAITGKLEIKPSANNFDWLGSGIYFWEADPERALQWAKDHVGNGVIRKAAVVGAIIDLRNCLNLTTQEGAQLVSAAYKSYKSLRTFEGKPLPQNADPKGQSGTDMLLRRLDNAVIEHAHTIVKAMGREEFDTVRGMFREGEAIYPGAGFWERTHVQIAVHNTDCIIGYFKPRLKSLSLK